MTAKLSTCLSLLLIKLWFELFVRLLLCWFIESIHKGVKTVEHDKVATIPEATAKFLNFVRKYMSTDRLPFSGHMILLWNYMTWVISAGKFKISHQPVNADPYQVPINAGSNRFTGLLLNQWKKNVLCYILKTVFLPTIEKKEQWFGYITEHLVGKLSYSRNACVLKLISTFLH